MLYQIKNLNVFLVVWILSLIFISVVGFSSIEKDPINGQNSFYQSLANWDGGHFLGIAENGYVNTFQYAFFPLYPLIVNFFSKITGFDFLTAGLLISYTFFLSTIYFLQKLLVLDYSKEFSKKIVYLLLIFPTSFFLLLPYSESMFLFFSVASFYFVRKKNYLLATIFTNLSCLTRLLGLAVVLGIWIEGYFDKNRDIKKMFLIFAPVGFLVYCFYLYNQTGNFLYFLTAEQNWQRNLSLPFVNIFFGWQQVLKNPKVLIDIFFLIFGAGMILRGLRYLRYSYRVYALISLLVPLLTNTLLSLPRFLLVIFPIFIVLGLIKDNLGVTIYQFLSILTLGIFVILFINGYWVS